MPSIDWGWDELNRYRATHAAPEDFDGAWERTLVEARRTPMRPQVTAVASGLARINVQDVTFPGFGGDPVKAWLLTPAGVSGRLPVIVTYNGYGGGRGLPLEHTLWASAGYAELFMDTRGQGSSWGSGGGTGDPHDAGVAGPGYMLRGIECFDTYYYRRLITDAVRAVDAVAVLPEVDPERIVLTGGSQGGGLTIASAALADGVLGAMPDVPFLCDFPRAVQVATTDPYLEVAHYLKVHRERVADVFATLNYIDGVHFAARATVPALFSVGLWDQTCPPSTVMAAYHAWAGAKEVAVYPYNDHEGGQAFQVQRQLAWLSSLLG